VRLRDLLSTGSLGLRLRTTPTAEQLDREISWVHTSELADPVPWLAQDELLLTTGMQFTAGIDAEEYVRRLAQSPVLALGFGIAPVHDTVPAGLVAAAERMRVPLVEVPSTTPFIAVSRAVAGWWMRRQTAGLQRVIDGQRGLARAAQSADPESQVLARLATELGCWALLTSLERDITAGDPPEEIRAWLVEEAPPPRAASMEHAGQFLLLHRLPGGSTPRLLVVGRGQAFTTEERSLVLVAESLLGTSSVSSRRAAQQALSALALELLADGQSEVGWHVARICVPAPLPDQWCAVAQQAAEHVTSFSAGPSSGGAAVLTAVVGPDRLWLVDARASELVLSRLERDELPAGYSDAVPSAQVTGALTQARRALQLARTRRLRTALGPAELASRSPLLLANVEQRAAAEELLRPLLADARGLVLMESLSGWFEAGQHWDSAARRLGVHRHTLRTRVEDAFQRLRRDSTDPRDLLDVWSSLVVTDVRSARP
jgi:purine catabolism regulator